MKTMRLLFFALAGLLLFFFIFLWQVQQQTPAIYQTADFIAFYTAGRLADEYGFSTVYALDKQYAVQRSLRGDALPRTETYPYNHLPFLLPVLRVIVGQDYQASMWRWQALLLAVHLGAVFVLVRGMPARSVRWMAGLGLALFFPAVVALLQGQDSPLLVLGGALWWHGLKQRNDRMAGLGLALTVVRPHLALLLAMSFWGRGRDAVGRWFTIAAGALAVFSLVLIGTSGTYAFLAILRLSSQGVGFQMHPEAMFNILGALVRWQPDLSPVFYERLSWGIFSLGLAGAWAWGRHWQAYRAFDVPGLILWALLTAPRLHYHDLSLLLVGLAILLEQLVAAGREQMAAWLPLLAAWLLFLTHYLPVRYLSMYALMLGMAWVVVTKPHLQG